MNLSPIAGFALAGLTVWYCVIAGSPNPQMLLDWKAFGLVTGGSLAAGLVIFPFRSLLGLWRLVLYGVILKRVPNRRRLVKEIVSASMLAPNEHALLASCPASHPFLAEGFALIADNRLDAQELHDVVHRRSAHFKQSYLSDAKMLATLAKFPSAFGMLGSTVGLIDMMSELGGPNGQAGIGPAMALAMVATFWGLVATYMILMPLSDYAARLAAEDHVVRQLIADGLSMIKQQRNPAMVMEKLNGFLEVADRVTHRKYSTSRGATDEQASWQSIEEEVDKIRKSA